MGINKVVFKDKVIIDISDSTVTPETLAKNKIAYGANGEKIVGTLESQTSTGNLDDELLACLLSGSSGGYGYSSNVLHIPRGCTYIGEGIFTRWYILETVYTEDVVEISNYAFNNCNGLKNIYFSNSLERIGNSAFEGCFPITTITFPSSLQYIGNYAFRGLSLTNITFNGTPETISSNAFEDCGSLTTINVPWSEGAVADAPWGATNATINYNYTG